MVFKGSIFVKFQIYTILFVLYFLELRMSAK